MIKNIKIIGLVLASMFVGCTTTTLKQVEVERTYNFPNLTQETLYNRAKLWTANYFNSSEDVITFEDKKLGELRLRYSEAYYADSWGNSYPLDRLDSKAFSEQNINKVNTQKWGVGNFEWGNFINFYIVAISIRDNKVGILIKTHNIGNDSTLRLERKRMDETLQSFYKAMNTDYR